MKIVEFFKKPRNLYLSIVAMLIVVFGLSSVTFSYYIEDSSDAEETLKVKTINTYIQTDDIESDEITLLPNETKLININVISENDYPNDYKLFYVGEGVTVTSDKEVAPTIEGKGKLNYQLSFTNDTEEVKVVKLGIMNGYIGSTLEVNGNEIK